MKKTGRYYLTHLKFLCQGLFFVFVFSANAQDSLEQDNTIKNLTVEQFNKLIINNDKAVLVNFSADWCVVCKREKPILDQLRAGHPTDLILLEIDMEENPLIAEYFEIDGLPVTIAYDKGVMTWNKMGFQTLQDLENAVWSAQPKKAKTNR